MGMFDILGGGSQRGGMSPLMRVLMGVLAYRTFKGRGPLADMFGMNAPASGIFEIHKDRGRHSAIVRNAAPDAAPDGSAAKSLPRISIQGIDIIGDPGWI
jgi:hypothetical protein